MNDSANVQTEDTAVERPPVSCYSKHDYLDEKRAALEVYAKHLLGVVE